MAPKAPNEIPALYRVLKQHAREVRIDRRLAVPPADSVTVHSKRCGSQLTLDARIADRRVQAIGYRVRACSLGQTATAIVARRAPGMDAEGLRRIGAQLRALLAGGATRCDWPEFEIFTLARDLPARHGAALLPFEALELLFERSRNPVESADAAVGATTPSARSH